MGNIGEFISKSVVSVGPSTTLRDAARAMTERRVGSAVVVTEQGQPAIITERDLMRAITASADLDRSLVEEYMTPDAITASPSWNIFDASRRMKEGGFRHLIVIDEDGMIAGVLSMRDLIAVLIDQVPGAPSGEPA